MYEYMHYICDVHGILGIYAHFVVCKFVYVIFQSWSSAALVKSHCWWRGGGPISAPRRRPQYVGRDTHTIFQFESFMVQDLSRTFAILGITGASKTKRFPGIVSTPLTD